MTAFEFDSAVARIVATCADYRASEIGPMSADRVHRWIDQFPEDQRLFVLQETGHILSRGYVSEVSLSRYLAGIVSAPKLTGGNPGSFWQGASILEIQQLGASQRDMVGALKAHLAAAGIAAGSVAVDKYVYIDDAIFSGGHLRQDLTKWIVETAPAAGAVHVVVTAIYAYAEYRALKASGCFQQIAQQAGKNLQFQIWRLVTLEDRRTYLSNSDVLRPKAVPDNATVAAYVAELEQERIERSNAGKPAYGITWRTGDGIGQRGTFSSVQARARYEEQMLIAGCEARAKCPNLPKAVRPLGIQGFPSLGFGALFVTHRNCPNNCPLAWWADEPWHALLPRRTNSTTALARMFEEI